MLLHEYDETLGRTADKVCAKKSLHRHPFLVRVLVRASVHGAILLALITSEANAGLRSLCSLLYGGCIVASLAFAFAPATLASKLVGTGSKLQ
jgi:hypothetical protein